jgi:hypothetical protein
VGKSKTETTALKLTNDELDRLLATVNSRQPTETQLAELRQALDSAPQLLERMSNLSHDLRRRIIESMSPNQSGMHIVLMSSAHAYLEALGYHSASVLEQMLIDQTVLAWLRLQMTEHRYQSFIDAGNTSRERDYWQRAMNSAQRNFLRATETLAKVRTLLHRRNVQVNIAQKQIVQNN